MDTVRYNAYDGYELNNLTPESNGQLRRKVHFNRSGSATVSPRSRAPPSDNNHPKTSTPIRGVKSQPTITTRSRAWTDDEILQVQTLLPGEPQPAIDFPGTPRSISRISSDYTTFTGLPSSETFDENTQDTILAYQSNGVRPRAVTPQLSTTSSTTSGSRQQSEMGGVDSKSSSRSIHPRNMMSVDPQEILDRRKLVSETDITGNCRPWSDHVYYKLFLDPDGRNATLMVLKCEITYVDVFTDEEHSLYKCRFIGGKADGVAQLFVFDLMKAKWEEKIPRSQAIELNVDIVMSSSPIHQCSETLLKLVQLEKTFLRHRNFDGQLNVTIRFAHSYGWDVKDDAIRERVHDGLRNLFREGVNLEVMSADIILDEIRVDEILATDDDLIKHYVSKRHAWTTPPLKASTTHSTSGESSTRHSTNRSNYDSDFSSASEEDFEYLSEDDMYHVFLLDNLDQILANQYRSKPTVTRRAGRGRKHNPKRNKPVW